MKVILENKISAVSATSENVNYPDDFVLNESPKRVWKADAGVDTATINCTTYGTINTIAIFNTNAESVTATISDPCSIEWPDCTWENLEWYERAATIDVDLVAHGENTAIWGEFETINYPVSIDITLSTQTGEAIKAGVIVIGEYAEFPAPAYGMSIGLEDFSIFEQLQNGSYFRKDRDRVRVFSLSSLFHRVNNFYTFIDFVSSYGRAPKAWKLSYLDSNKWVVYAMLNGMPSGSFRYQNHIPINATLIEVI